MTTSASGVTSLDARDKRAALILIACGLLVQLPGLLWGAPGGKAINNGLRVLAGDIPYRDFWTMYAPGHFYVVAAVFKLFGTHIWTQGVASQLLVALDSALLFVLVRRIGAPRVPALGVAAVFVGSQWGVRPEMSSYECVLALLLPALDRVVCYTQGAGARALVVAGALCGVGAWFKHDVSFHIAFGIFVGLSVAWWLLDGRRPAAWVGPTGVLIRVGGGALATALPVIALLLWKAGADVWKDLIVFPATDFPVVRGEGYPAAIPEWRLLAPWLGDPLDAQRASEVADYLASWVLANVPQIVYVAAVVIVARYRRSLPPAAVGVGAVALAAMPLFWAAAHVQQNTHLESLALFSCILVTLAWTSGLDRRRLRAATLALGVPLVGALLTAPALFAAEAGYFWRNHARLDFPSASGVRLPRWRYNVYEPIVSWIRQNVPENEAIYVGLVRNDSIVISNQTFYYLAGRPIASRYNEIHPGIVDRDEVQREIVRDLERLHVRCAVLWDFGWGKPMMDRILAERRKVIPALGATVLDEYFQTQFRPVARFGEYVLMWRRDSPMPPPPASRGAAKPGRLAEESDSPPISGGTPAPSPVDRGSPERHPR